MNDPLRILHAQIEPHLGRIERLLPPEYKLTLVARNTARPDADIVLTLDKEPAKVAGAVLSLVAGLAGVAMIAAERSRGITVEGWTAAHDDEHKHGQLAAAAITYADTALVRITYIEPSAQNAIITDIMADRWPFEEQWFKASADPVENLVKAGALIAAEIDRLQRLKAEGKS